MTAIEGFWLGVFVMWLVFALRRWLAEDVRRKKALEERSKHE